MSDLPIFASVRVIMSNAHGEILFVRRSPSSNSGAGMWEMPGGKIDQGESIDIAFEREVLEETGLVISEAEFITAVENRLEDKRIIYLVFASKADTGNVSLSDEHDEFCWMPASRAIATLKMRRPMYPMLELWMKQH